MEKDANLVFIAEVFSSLEITEMVKESIDKFKMGKIFLIRLHYYIKVLLTFAQLYVLTLLLLFLT